MKETFTGIVRIKGDEKNRVISVKSNKEVDRSDFVEFSKVLSRTYVGSSTKAGDIICKNILNTGIDIICTKNIDNNV